jgi:deoxyribodipyrimidine photo-lyase
MTSIVWFRRDLRLSDNPAWAEAAKLGPVIPVFILDEETPNTLGGGVRPLGGASRWWLHHSLAALNDQLSGALVLRRGEPLKILTTLLKETGADAVLWNRLYEAGEIARDSKIKSALEGKGVAVKSFNALLLNEPWEVKNKTGEPYKVFTPYWRAAAQLDVRAPTRAPRVKTEKADSEELADWGLTPRKPDWAKGWETLWTPGERGAAKRLKEFLEEAIADYAEGRDRPDKALTSRLSPHLHWGEISPRQIVVASEDGRGRDAFVRELYWREFSYHLLFHYPDLAEKNWKPAFDAFPWRKSQKDLRAWQKGMTGYPLIDAGMRELWATGYMHNRVRMVVASFLIKNLRIHWREGEAWFWDTLVDADAANNAASWQWVAGSGADAAPYFRIFNPVSQGRKFDPDGVYVRRWIPELAALSNEHIHAPFEAPPLDLGAAGITLGKTYPHPIVALGRSRAEALEGYKAVQAAQN